MSPTRELDTVMRIARDIDELDELERALGRNQDARRRVVRMRRRRLDEAPAVRLSVAGHLLALSAPTVRAWINRGLLEEVAGASPRKVTFESVLTIRPIVEELRQLGRDRGLLEAVIAKIEDDHALSDRKLERSLDEMRNGELIDITPQAGA